jgi:Sec-independent protein translocase protein TatA
MRNALGLIAWWTLIIIALVIRLITGRFPKWAKNVNGNGIEVME